MSRAQRFLLGSVSGRVLEYASCSVVIAKRRPGEAVPESIEPGTNAAYNIMLAYDVSDVASEALEVCASFPLEEHSRITVVNVMPLITAYRQDVRQHINSIWMQKKIIMQAELDKAVKSKQWFTSNLTTQLREATNVSAEILGAAEETGSDLIMVGCKDKSPLQRFLLGSITLRMARYAECTVWAVRNKTGTA
jgi:nucleotide-binding universal stress UspA family protein